MEKTEETTYQGEERRRYLRLQPTVEPEPQATFEMNSKTFDVKVVNISPGGLLCYADKKLSDCQVETIIPKIVVKIHNKKPVIYRGVIVRVQPSSEPKKQFCAIEFVENEQKVLKKGSKPLKQFLPDAADEIYLQRLQSYQNFLKASSIEEELSLRKVIYDGFQPESKKLPLEERWFFYEIIDEMKCREPQYPIELKHEFFRLCRGENRSEFVLKEKPQKGIKGFLKRILTI